MNSPDSPWRLSQNEGYTAPKRKVIDVEATASKSDRRLKPKSAVMETFFHSAASNEQLRGLLNNNLDSISRRKTETEEQAGDRRHREMLIGNLKAKMANFDQVKDRLVAVCAAMDTSDMPQSQIDEHKVLASTIPRQMGMSAVVDSFCDVIAGQTKRLQNYHSSRVPKPDTALEDKEESMVGRQEEVESIQQKLKNCEYENRQLLAALKKEEGRTTQLRANIQRQKLDSARYEAKLENAVNEAKAESMREIEVLRSQLASITDDHRNLQLLDDETSGRIVTRAPPDRAVAVCRCHNENLHGSRQEQQMPQALTSSNDENIETVHRQLQEDRKAHREELAKARHENGEALAAAKAETSHIRNTYHQKCDAWRVEKKALATAIERKDLEIENTKSDSRDAIMERDDQINRLTRQLTTTRNNLSRTRSTFRQDCKATNLEIETIESDSRQAIDGRDAEIAKLTGCLTESRSACEMNREALEDVKCDIKAIESELIKSNGRVTQGDATLAAKVKELEKMTTAKDEMNRKMAQLQLDLVDATEGKALVEEELRGVRKDLGAITADKQKMDGDMAALKVDLERANSFNAELDSKLSVQARVSARKISDLEGILAGQQTECCRHMEIIEADSKRIKALDEARVMAERKLDHDLEACKADLSSAQIDIGKKTGEIASRDDELFRLLKANESSGRELENFQRANSEYRQQCDQLDGRVFDLQSELDGANSRLEELGSQIGLLRNELVIESAARSASVEKVKATEHLIDLLGVVFGKVKKGDLPVLGSWVAAQVFRCLSRNPIAAASISDILTTVSGTDYSLLRACWEVLEDTDRSSGKTCEQAIFDAFSSWLVEHPQQGRAVRCVQGCQNVIVYIYVQVDEGEVLVVIQAPDQSYTTSQYKAVECGVFTWEWYEWLRLDNGADKEPIYLRIDEDEDTTLWFSDIFPTRMPSPDASKGTF